jgi:hypothetical protein
MPNGPAARPVAAVANNIWRRESPEAVDWIVIGHPLQWTLCRNGML